MQLAPGTCVAAAKAVVKTKNIRGEEEEDKGQSELGDAKGFGVSRTKKTSPNLIDFYVAPETTITWNCKKLKYTMKSLSKNANGQILVSRVRTMFMIIYDKRRHQSRRQRTQIKMDTQLTYN